MKKMRLLVGIAVALYLAGCATPGYVLFAIGDYARPSCLRGSEIRFRDMSDPPRVSLVDEETIQISHIDPTEVSDFWAVPKIRVQGEKAFIIGYYTCREKDGPFIVTVPRGDVRLSDMNYFWIDPDGSETKLVVDREDENR